MREASPADELLLAAQVPVNVLVISASRDDRMSCARFIHDNSERRRGPFVARGPYDLRHAIDAADVDRWFEQAPGGTLFIDDMSRLSRQGQEQLLLRLEHNALGQLGESNGAGGRRVRVIAGASRVLLAAVAANAFSETLYYRLNLIHVDRTGLKDS